MGRIFDVGYNPTTMDKQPCGSGGKNTAKWDDKAKN